MDRKLLTGHVAAAGAYTIFGLNIVFCKDIANAMAVSPIGLFTMRAIGASLLFWLTSLFLPKEKVDRKDIIPIIAASLLGLFAPQMTFLKAITMASPVDTAILSAFTPVVTMIIAAIVIKEPITLKKAGGVFMSLGGVILLILNSLHFARGGAETKPLGVILLLLNSISFAAYLGIFKPLIAKYNVVTFMKWMFLVSLVVSLPFSAADLMHTDFTAIETKVLWEIGFLIFFATFVAYFLIPVGQKRLRPTLVSMYTYLQPILACVISIIVGMDVITWQKVLAIVLVFGGVAIVNRSRAAGQAH